MFVAITIDIKCRSGWLVPGIQEAMYAHACAMHLITSEDVDLGREMHDRQRNKPIAIAIVSAKQGKATLRMSFLGDRGIAAANAVATALMNISGLQLGQTFWEVIGIQRSESKWTGVATWADIMASEPRNRVYFEFVTPTAFTKTGNQGERFVSVLPDATDLFTGLARRWVDLGGPIMPTNLADYLRSGGCIISELGIHTVTCNLTDRTQKGFVGRVTYECDMRDQMCAVAVNQLARLAFYSGVGYQTARGMGAVLTRV